MKQKSRSKELESLNQFLEDRDVSKFLVYLRGLVSEHGGIKDVSSTTKLHRVSVHKMLSTSGNPKLTSLIELLAALNLKLEVKKMSNAK